MLMDPVLAQIGGIKFWYHGLAYSMGFLSIFLWTFFRQKHIGLSTGQVFNLSISFSVLSLIGGRSFAVWIQEWDLFQGKYSEMIAFWHGGMALPGFIAGGLVAVVVFCWTYKKRFLALTDEMIVPLCLLFSLTRIGHYINGETCEYMCKAWWTVKFFPIESFRYPVEIYDALKWIIIGIGLSFMAGNAGLGRGKITGYFLLWAGLLSLITDLFRIEHYVSLEFGLAQFFNIVLAILGISVTVWSKRKESKKKWSDLSTIQFTPVSVMTRIPSGITFSMALRICIFLLILLFCLTISSGSSQEHLLNTLSHNKDLAI